jgi:hypothetical protein
MTPDLDALMARLAWHRRALAEVAADFGLPAPSGLERPMADLDALRRRRDELKAERRRHGGLPPGKAAELRSINREVARWARECDPACDDCRPGVPCNACRASRPRDRASVFDRGECRGK